MYKLEPTEHWKDTIEDLIFENETQDMADTFTEIQPILVKTENINAIVTEFFDNL